MVTLEVCAGIVRGDARFYQALLRRIPRDGSMENGGHVEQGPMSPMSAVMKDNYVEDAVLALVLVPADGTREVMAGLSAENEVADGDDVDEVVEDEDVYSIDVKDELATSNRFVSNGPTTAAMASAAPEFDREVSTEADTVWSTLISESASEFKLAIESGPAEIQAADPLAGRSVTFLEEDVTNPNEIPKLELESSRESATAGGASPVLADRNFLRAAQVSAVLQEALEKSELVGQLVSRPVLGRNESPETLEIAEDLHSNATAFPIVKGEEAISLDDADATLVAAVACDTDYVSGCKHEFSRAVMHRESDAGQVLDDSKELGQPSGRTEESSGNRSRPNVAWGVVLDAEVLVPGGLSPKTGRSELEREMELYEVSEREQAQSLDHMRGDQQREDQHNESQIDKKRTLDMPSPGRQRKLSRKMSPGDERKKDEEDVCFICFDGGDLVLCDRRSCPKAYHLSCIGRDAAFFKKKGAWLCGWHFCSVCTKPGSFQCYTCPTAYCGSCIDKAEFLLLRKRKGLCEDCLPIVSMIERNETINVDGVEVDFEDQETYECLFKEYWEDLKRLLSLKMPELDKEGKPVDGGSSMLNHVGSESDDHTENYESDKESDESDHRDDEPFGSAWMKRKVNKNRIVSNVSDENMDPEDEYEEGDQEIVRVFGYQKFESWASKELLDFIDHMKEDPLKPLSRFAVNKLLWSYIKRHKLQDARKSSQINCDERLKSIFRKESVGQFEMFKHLQLHFPTRSSVDNTQSIDGTKSIEGSKRKDVQSGYYAMIEDDGIGLDGSEDKLGTGGAKERRRGRRSAEEKFERPNSSEYAAITPKNIDMIYLRRALLRDLLEDPEFDNKVVDTFVRIRVPGISTKTETTYRLVLVTGTRIGEESYKAGTKMTNVVLEILNLQKKEDVTVDLVSNQDFTEEECQRLRQSIKCGFIKALVVGQVEEKAIALRLAKVNDWFENERQRLVNLRDRASEKGRKKELRECVEKLQELGSPAFRAAKLQARPEVTADPHMDPGYESDVHEISPLQGGNRKFRPKVSLRGGWEKGAGSGLSTWDDSKFVESIYSGRKVDFDHQRLKSSWEETGRSRGYGRVEYEGGRSSEKLGLGRESAFRVDEKLYNIDEREKPRPWDMDWERDQSREQDRTRDDGYYWNGNGGRSDTDQWTAELGDLKYGRGEVKAGNTPVFGQSRSEWGGNRVETVPSTTLSSATLGFGAASPALQSLVALEKEKLWYYQDPTGMVQGPFTMEQLRKWSTTGLFPVNLTIWKTGQVQENSMLLTDALAGKFKEEVWTASRSRPREFTVDDSLTSWGGSSWNSGDPGHSASRAEQDQAVGGVDWGSRDAVERGRNWARGQSSYSVSPLSTGRADDWNGSRSRVESDTWGSSRKGADGSSWGGSESGKSTYGRSSSCREHDVPAVRDGSRSMRPARGSKKDVPCRFYAKGYCKRGDACEFWHG